MRHKGRELEMGRAKKRQSKRGGLDNVIPRSQETAPTIRKKNESPVEQRRLTAWGQAIIRHWMTKVLRELKMEPDRTHIV